MSIAICVTANTLAWGPPIIYFFSLWPQIYTNWKTKSAEGLSHRMLYLLAFGSCMSMLYEWFMCLPLAFRIMRPFSLTAVALVIAQAFLYTSKPQIRRYILLSYAILIGCVAVLGCVGFMYPTQVGHLVGWIAALVYAFYPIPQVVKNFKRKSTQGLNFAFLTMVFFGNLIEMTAAMLFNLPMQSMVHGLRGMLYYSLFCYQFVLYSDRTHADKH